MAAVGLLSMAGMTACASSDSGSNSSGPTSALPSNAATGEPINIGFITGEGGAISIPALREGGQAAADYLNNNAGGVAGHKVNLIVCKQQEDPASATKCANQLVEQKVSAVMSPAGGQGSVLVPIITGAKIPYIAQAPVTQAEMAAPGSFMLTGGIVSVMAGQAAAAAKAGIKSVTVIVGDSGDAAASIKALGAPMFQRAGVGFDVVTVPASTADPTAQITAAMANKPGAVSLLADGTQCISALKALQTVAPTVTKYLVASCIDKAVVQAVGNQALTGSKAFTTVALNNTDPTVTQYRSVMAQYAPGTDPAGLAYIGYQVVMSLAGVGKTLPAGQVSAEQIATAYATAKNVPLAAAPGITFTCNGSAFPQLTALCSKAILMSDVTDTATLTNTTVINAG
ncbi:ABC transporter substrate-binding protein [Gordonia sp. NPDC003425]